MMQLLEHAVDRRLMSRHSRATSLGSSVNWGDLGIQDKAEPPAKLERFERFVTDCEFREYAYHL